MLLGITAMDLKLLFDRITDISTLKKIPFYVAFNELLEDARKKLMQN
jgi:hypothetical protein